MSIYGKYAEYLPKILDETLATIKKIGQDYQAKTGQKLYEHLEGRVKGEQSMTEKCERKGLPKTPEAALIENRDSIGIRIVCNFIDDIYACLDLLRQVDKFELFNEKDYITNAKPNGYRSYHLILKVKTPYEDVHGDTPGTYYVEIQLRTIAMDTWASLEHEMKYKHDIHDPERISKELKRVADELAACDVSLQTIRQLIKEG